MKLAFCLFNYFPFGGLQRDFLRIAKLCVEHGHEIDVFTMAWDAEPEPGLHIHLLAAPGKQNHSRCASFIKNCHVQLAARAYDVVIGFNKMPGLDIYYAADVCYQTRVREHRTFITRYMPRYCQMVAFERAVFAKGKQTEILLLSQKQQTEYTQCYHTEAERFHLLPPGIAKDRIAPNNADEIRKTIRQREGIGAHQIILLAVGSGFKTKGLDRTLKSIAALKPQLRNNCSLWVIGDDNPRYFAKLAQRLNIAEQIKFFGGRADVPDFLLAADFLIHPAYHENTGTVLLEALASGLPVLTVDVCGYAHYVTDAEAGLVLSSPFEQNDLNKALTYLLTTNKRTQWQKNALNFAKNTDIYSLPNKAVDFIEKFSLAKFAKQQTHKAKLTASSGQLYLDPTLASSFDRTQPLFDQIMALKGEVFRNQKGRLTQRLVLENQAYFIKQHHGVGWREIIKNILQCRWPVTTAKNEWLAIQRLHIAGVNTPTVVGYGEQGVNPARKKSFILMKELSPTISLESLSQQWSKQPPSFIFKRALIKNVAEITRKLHRAGLNHRDLYICHFLLDNKAPDALVNPKNICLYLIDLHRATLWHHIPQRWLIKDLAGLYFSSKDCGLTRHDFYYFMKIYRDKSLKTIFNTENEFWHKVKIRGDKLYRDTNEK